MFSAITHRLHISLRTTLFFLALLGTFGFLQLILPSLVHAGGGDVIAGPLNIQLNLFDEFGNPIAPAVAPPAITSDGVGGASWCWSGQCWSGTDTDALNFVTYYLGLVVSEYGSQTRGSTVVYDSAGRVIYIACVNGGTVTVTYSDPGGTTDLCPLDPGIQTSLSMCSCTPTAPSCEISTCNTTTCYDGCIVKTGTMDCSSTQTASLFAVPTTINLGNSTSLNYECAPAVPAHILPTIGTLNPGFPVGRGSVSAAPVTSTTYTLTCFGTTIQTASAAVTVDSCVVYDGQPCKSAANICSMTNSGTFNCAGVCSAVKPLDSLCGGPGGTLSVNPTSITLGSKVFFDFTCDNTPNDATNIRNQNPAHLDTNSPGHIPGAPSQTGVQHRPRYVGTESYFLRCFTNPSAVAVDPVGAVVSVNITAPPKPTLEVQVNGGGWTTANQTVNTGDSVKVRWNGNYLFYKNYQNPTYPENCSGSGFSSGGLIANMSGTISATVPPPGSSSNVQLSCAELSSYDGSTTYSDTSNVVRITTNAALPAPTATLQTQVNGGAWLSGNQTVLSTDTLMLRWASTDATSCNVTAGAAAGFSTAGAPSGTDAVTNPGVGGSTLFGASCSGPGGSTGTSITINALAPPPPDPGLTLTTNKTNVRKNETVTLTWASAAVAVPSDWSCKVFGPGGVSASTRSISGGSTSSGQIAAKSQFVLSCTHNPSNTIFVTSPVIVETTGEIQEI